MARAGEKTLELNICAEIVYYHWKRSHRRILFFGPSLRQEAKLGYDVRAFASRVKPFYIQFKSGKKASGNLAIYEINNDTHHRQHRLLEQLSRTAKVYYGLPLMFTMKDIQQSAWQLLSSTCWPELKRMPPLPQPHNANHEIRMDLATRLFSIYSQQRGGDNESLSWAEVYEDLTIEQEYVETESILRENDTAIREILRIEEIPDDISSGLVFGAME